MGNGRGGRRLARGGAGRGGIEQQQAGAEAVAA